MPNTLIVFLGGGLGSVCRYWIGLLLAPFALRFPLATLFSNVFAALVIAFLAALMGKGLLSPHHRLLITTGFCGGLSTFSTFSAETMVLFQNGHIGMAVLNILCNIGLCLGAYWVVVSYYG
jgi:fluoride exporter